jgi:hypothetical protein
MKKNSDSTKDIVFVRISTPVAILPAESPNCKQSRSMPLGELILKLKMDLRLKVPFTIRDPYAHQSLTNHITFRPI